MAIFEYFWVFLGIFRYFWVVLENFGVFLGSFGISNFLLDTRYEVFIGHSLLSFFWTLVLKFLLDVVS